MACKASLLLLIARGGRSTSAAVRSVGVAALTFARSAERAALLHKFPPPRVNRVPYYSAAPPAASAFRMAMACKMSLLLLIARAARSTSAAVHSVGLAVLTLACSAERAALLPKPPPRVITEYPYYSAAAARPPARAAAPPPPPPPANAAAPPPPPPPANAAAPPPPEGKSLRGKFVAEDKDVESDEAVWALYQRWCKAFDQQRDHDEMLSRFYDFKQSVLRIRRLNSNPNPPNKFAINQYTDGKLKELLFKGDPRHVHEFVGIPKGSCVKMLRGKKLRQVHADFEVVDGKLFVDLPQGVYLGDP